MARKKLPDDPRDFTKQSDQYIISIITEDMERANAFQTPYFEKFAEWYRLYNGIMLESEKRQNGANLFIPYIYNIVETAIPKIIGSVMDAKPFISYKPVSDDDVEKGEKMTTLVDFQLRHYMNAATRFYEIFKSAIVYGTAISKQTWRYETKTVKRRRMVPTQEDVDGEMMDTEALSPVPEEKVMYDAPEIKNIPLEQFFFDPAYTDIDSSPWCCHEYWKEKYELIAGAKAGVYKNIDKITTDDEHGGPLENRLMTYQSNTGHMRDGVRIWEYWTDDCKVMVANKSVVILNIENPYYHRRKPFTKWTPIPMPGEFYGKSMIETLVDLQAELNTLRSQRIDNVSLALNRMFIVNKQAQIDPAQLVSRPNGYIEVEDITNDIKEMIVNDVTSSAYKDEDIVKQDMDVTSGVHNYDRGQEGDRKDTATVANLLSSASSERFKLQVMMMEEDPMSDVGQQLAELNKQFIDGSVWVRITQKDGSSVSQEITFDDIDTEFDIISVGTAIEPSVNKDVRQSQLIQLLQTASTVQGVNTVELLRQLFEEFDFKDIDKLVSAPLPTPPVEGEEAGEEGEQVPGQEEAPQGLYPQTGGVGGMAQYLQNPNA